jgi:hypothetical protein
MEFNNTSHVLNSTVDHANTIRTIAAGHIAAGLTPPAPAAAHSPAFSLPFTDLTRSPNPLTAQTRSAAWNTLVTRLEATFGRFSTVFGRPTPGPSNPTT